MNKIHRMESGLGPEARRIRGVEFQILSTLLILSKNQISLLPP